MTKAIVHVAIVVDDYDRAIAFYTEVLGFDLIEDTYQPEQDKRWVIVAPPGGDGTALLLARATNERQREAIGNQAGGRVFLFLRSIDFDADFARLVEHGVTIVREPSVQSYGKVAVFEDLYGNLWDMIQYSAGHRFACPAE